MTPRRRFLILAAGAAAMPRLAFAEGESAAARLVAAVREPSSATVLGRAYRVRFPREPTGEALAREILASLPAAARNAGPHVLRAALRERVRADFAADHVVRLDGWRLALTEARLAALCATADPVL
ncbi:MAG TPA: hypothetical protein VLV50_04615 [Stellaceae bacterium]|nr:hypothetical protein [Stellaceae bacterium]